MMIFRQEETIVVLLKIIAWLSVLVALLVAMFGGDDDI